MAIRRTAYEAAGPWCARLPATAAQLHRAAAELRERAGSPYAVPTLPVTLAHLEDAFDELAATMRLLAEDAAGWCGMDDADAPPRGGQRAAVAPAFRRLGAQLTLVHVTRTVVPVDSFPMSVDPCPVPRSRDLAFSEAEAAFDSLSADFAAAGVEREVRLGEPAAVLARVSADIGAELIVVGSRGRGAWRAAVLGSGSGDVARLAPCPVMIVPERAAEVHTAA